MQVHCTASQPVPVNAHSLTQTHCNDGHGRASSVEGWLEARLESYYSLRPQQLSLIVLVALVCGCLCEFRLLCSKLASIFRSTHVILVELVQVGPIVVHGHVLVLLHAIPHTCEREVDCTVLTTAYTKTGHSLPRGRNQ